MAERTTREQQKRLVVRVEASVAEGLAERARREGTSIQSLLEAYAVLLARGGEVAGGLSAELRMPLAGTFVLWSSGPTGGGALPAAELAALLAGAGRRTVLVQCEDDGGDVRDVTGLPVPAGGRHAVTPAELLAGSLPVVSWKGFDILHLGDVEGLAESRNPGQWKALGSLLRTRHPYDIVLLSLGCNGHREALEAADAVGILADQSFPSLAHAHAVLASGGPATEAAGRSVVALWDHSATTAGFPPAEVFAYFGMPCVTVPRGPAMLNAEGLLPSELPEATARREGLRSLLDGLAGASLPA